MNIDKIKNKCYTIRHIIPNILLRGDYIKKLTNKAKIWFDKRSRKILLKRSKTKKRNALLGKIEYNTNFNRNVYIEFKNSVPSNFSIIENSGETLLYFQNMWLQKNSLNKTQKAKFYLDMSEVANLGIETLLYLIAFMESSNTFQYKYDFYGNFPKTEQLKQLLLDCGFIGYVSTSNKTIIPQVDSIKIIIGENTEETQAKSICNFVHSKTSLKIKDTHWLYEILIELMNNTGDHAYDDTVSSMSKKWYLFAEELNDTINFVFLDTGLSIPKTVHKKFYESLINVKDSDILESALCGEFRTKTKEKNRGKGLPQISYCFKNKLIQKVMAISGKGVCLLNEACSDNYIKIENESRLEGTLFSWTMKKER